MRVESSRLPSCDKPRCAYFARAPEVRRTLEALGYPLYFATIVGVWKALGAIAILAPRFERLKEWAYAGVVFDLSSAAISHAVVGDPVGKVMGPLILLGLTFVSWAYRPADRRLPSREASSPARSLPQADALASS